MTVASDSSPGSLGKGKGKGWPPGFRFHPTDEELVLYYLKRKICRKSLQPDIIGETDVYKWDPEELPGLSLLQTGDRQWFFFTPRDRKYPNGARSNRATRHGYWKVTGKDRNITCNSRNVGIKKTLVFYKGRAPCGERTDWIMHEYTLDEEELKRCQNFKEYHALYKVFKKSGLGPKNGEQYGAPFNEEEWAVDHYVDFNVIAADIECPRKQIAEVSPVVTIEIKDHAESSWDGDDIDDIIKEFLANPAFDMPQVAENSYSFSQVGEEPEHAAVQHFTSEVLAPAALQADFPDSQQCNVEPSYDFIQSTFTQLPLHESSDVTSAPATLHTYYPTSQEYDAQLSYEVPPNSNQLSLYEPSEVTSAKSVQEQKRQICGKGDFLEIDDLLSPDLILSNVDTSSDGLRIDDLDGLGEFDLYHDAAPVFMDAGLNGHETDLPPSYFNSFNNNNVNHDFQMPSNPDVSYQMGDQLWIDSQRNGFNSAQLMDGSLSQQTSGTLYESGIILNDSIRNSNSNEGADGTSRLSSALWAFVESIPTNPASASENKLVHLALERMSSFSRLKNHVKPSVGAAGNDNSSIRQAPRKRVSFIFFPVVVACCAILWMSIGTFRLLGI